MDIYNELNTNCEYKDSEHFLQWSDRRYIDYDNIENNKCIYVYNYRDDYSDLCYNCKQTIQKLANENNMRKIDLLKLSVDNAKLILDNEKLMLEVERLTNDMNTIKEHLGL